MSTAYPNRTRRPPAPGATALGSPTGRHRHRLGDALRAVRVFAGAAFSVVVMGEYSDR